MNAIRLHFLPPLADLVARLQDRLDDVCIKPDWVCIAEPELYQSAISADLLLVGQSFTDGNYAQLVCRRPTLLLLDECDLGIAAKWLALGFDACLAIDELEPVLMYILGYYYRKHHRHKLIDHEASPELLQAVIDAIPLPVFYKDQCGLYLGGNREFERYMGVPIEELRGKTVYYSSPPELADVYAQSDQALLASGESQQYETQVVWDDGSRRDVEIHKALFQQANGEVGGLVGVLLDITEQKCLSEQLTELATTDPLTGALNLRSFNEIAERERRLFQRHRRQLCILMLDIDHFKKVNDAYGHSGGDEVLRALVKKVQGMLRKEDSLFRVGGEEFYVLLSHTGIRRAGQIAERLRRMMEEMTVCHNGRSIRFTVSIGVAEMKAKVSIKRWMDSADDALYRAKAGGRNRVEFARR